MLFVLLRNDNVIGSFDNLKECNRIILGLVNNSFLDNDEVKVLSYYNNSITEDKTFRNNLLVEDNNSSESEEDLIDEFTQQSTTEDNNDNNNEEDFDRLESSVDSEEERRKKAEEAKILKKKSKLQYNLTLLKQKKEKIEESKRTYQVDFELYKKFKNILKKNEQFVVPDLFEHKFKTFETLINEERLNWTNFHDLYEQRPVDNKWSGLFSGNGKERELLEISDDDNRNDDNRNDDNKNDDNQNDDNQNNNNNDNNDNTSDINEN